ncbi:Gp138 family membrane-puncturing spike protein [Bombella saccharophila]|uniref:Baseplate assembly protein n=1 Tax=Bombella saccharophila TaxID=2967338 RepID=A0ABT3W6E5_9PROT|nr:Gp138 family membrane-puncturing spike protein [Bombella saccharophila]MCX5614446.1 baseplate assembly protein [Bombella saccharophila]
MSKLGTPLLVKVEAVHPGEASITGSVDVQPMVHQQDKQGKPYPRQVIHNVPYLRIQGGTSALIIDPKLGDIGFIIISGRDHTHAVTSRQPSPPASFRQFAMQDCVYVGGFLNNGPDQFIQATAQGWRIVTPGIVSIEATKITANCDIETSGDVKAGGISLKQHTHGGVQAGGGKTSPPS